MKILVADDAATIRKVIRELLTSAGYDVLEASDGEQVLKLAHEERPDLIVLDLVMPKATGFDVLREIRRDPRVRNTPILIVSEVIHGQWANDILHRHEIAGFIGKANIMNSLLPRVQEILSRKAHRVA